VVVAWNELAHDIGYAEDQFRTFKAQRAMAMTHLAMHDAVNAVVDRYAPHAYARRQPKAEPIGAAAQAAREVLAALYPAAVPRLDAELGRWLAPAAPEVLARSVALGRAAASAVLEARRDDGWDAPGTYSFASGPGAYQTTPPWDSFVLQPGFRYARPFGLRSPSQLRPPPPPPLDSAETAGALAEVRRYGGRDSTARTTEQSAYAVWWMEFAEGSVNRLARRLVAAQDLDLADSARLFALLDMSLYDAYVATWDAKYHYDHWRPYTAIRAHPGTGGDPAWEPLRPTPPFPEYVSAHAAGCAAAFEVLRHALASPGRFTMRTTTAPEGSPERSFDSFDAAAAECADSRVRLGWHFRYATDAGLELGRAVATWEVEHHLRPVGSHEPGGTGANP
jgi:hypothetical protein